MTDRHDPRDCWHCHRRGRVIDFAPRDGYIYRRFQCPECDRRWTGYESRMNPRKQISRVFRQHGIR